VNGLIAVVPVVVAGSFRPPTDLDAAFEQPMQQLGLSSIRKERNWILESQVWIFDRYRL